MRGNAALQAVMQPTEPTRESVVDEFARLDAACKSFKPTKDRRDKLRETILSWYPDTELAPGVAGRVEGIESIVLIAPRERQRKVRNWEKLAKAFGGMRKLLAKCTITIKAVEAELGEDAAAVYLVAAHTGPREVTAIPRPPAEEAKAA